MSTAVPSSSGKLLIGAKIRQILDGSKDAPPSPTNTQKDYPHTMTHPLVLQLRFTRSEFQRALAGISEEDGFRRIEPIWSPICRGKNSAIG